MYGSAAREFTVHVAVEERQPRHAKRCDSEERQIELGRHYHRKLPASRGD